MQHQQCVSCWRINWRTDEGGQQRQHSLVFLPAAQLTTTFVSVACATAGCRGVLQIGHYGMSMTVTFRVSQATHNISRFYQSCSLDSCGSLQPVCAQVDGREYGLLRKTPRLAFGLCLLYIWLQMMGAGGVKWWTFWRDTLYAYSRHCYAALGCCISPFDRQPHSVGQPLCAYQQMHPHPHMQLRVVTSTACSASFDTKRRWLQSYHRPFKHATFDFVDLMQINWRAAFYCPNAADHLTADGICIGHKLAQSFIVRPWEAASDTPLAPGTVLRSRLMVPEPHCRKACCSSPAPAPAACQQTICSSW
jgi:hypothetical protein